MNSDNANHGSDQSVQIAAGSAFDHLGIVVAAGGAGKAAIMPAAHFSFADITTAATVNGASINAWNNVAVRADAHQDIQSVGFVLAGSGVGASLAPTAWRPTCGNLS